MKLEKERTNARMELDLAPYHGTGRVSDNWNACNSSMRGSLVSGRHAPSATPAADTPDHPFPRHLHHLRHLRRGLDIIVPAVILGA